MECTGSSPCYRSYPVLVEQSCLEYLVPQTPLNVEKTEGGKEGGRETGKEGGKREGESCHN